MIDWSKPIQTKGGKKSRLLGKVDSSTFPMVVATVEDGEEHPYTYTKEGKFFKSSGDEYGDDLVNVPEKMKLHIFRSNGELTVHTTNDSCADFLNDGTIIEVDSF